MNGFFCLKGKKKRKSCLLPMYTYVPPFFGMGETFRNSNNVIVGSQATKIDIRWMMFIEFSRPTHGLFVSIFIHLFMKIKLWVTLQPGI